MFHEVEGVAKCTMSGMKCCAGSRNLLRSALGDCMAGRFSNKNNQNKPDSSSSDYLKALMDSVRQV